MYTIQTTPIMHQKNSIYWYIWKILVWSDNAIRNYTSAQKTH